MQGMGWEGKEQAKQKYKVPSYMVETRDELCTSGKKITLKYNLSHSTAAVNHWDRRQVDAVNNVEILVRTIGVVACPNNLCQQRQSMWQNRCGCHCKIFYPYLWPLMYINTNQTLPNIFIIRGCFQSLS